MNKIDKNIFKYIKYLKQIHKNDIFALKTIFHISEKGGTNMKTGDIVFLRRPYKGYRAVELMERLECRWLVRIVESGLELEVYEDELISEF